MKTNSISKWMKGFYYGRPIASRPARTAAGHFRLIIGVLVAMLLGLHLAYLLLAPPDPPYPLIWFLIASMVIYGLYVGVRSAIPVRWEARYYTPWIQGLRAEGGLVGTALLMGVFAWFRQDNLLWPLLLLPILLLSEHGPTKWLLFGLGQAVIVALSAAWLDSRQPLVAFLTGQAVFQAGTEGVTIVLFGFLFHYMMRNLSARDERIDQLRQLLAAIAPDLSAAQSTDAMQERTIRAFMEVVEAQCGSIWVAGRQPGVLRLQAQVDDTPQHAASCVLAAELDDAAGATLPALVLQSGRTQCFSRAPHSPLVFVGTTAEVGVPLQAFQLDRPRSTATLVLGFTRPMGKDEVRRVHLTLEEIAGQFSPLFYYVSLRAEYEALRDLGHAVSANLEQAPVIGALLELITTTLGFDFATVSLVDKVRQVIATVDGLGVAREWIERAVHPLDGSDIQADIVRRGEPEILRGWDPRFDRTIWEKFGHDKMMRVFIPMRVKTSAGKMCCIGTVEAGYRDAAQAEISGQQVDLLRPFVDQAAVAVYKARLYDEAQHRTQALERLHQVGRAIQGAVWSLSQLMQEIGDSALDVLQADIVLLYGYDRDARRIELLHTAGQIRGSSPPTPRLDEGNILDWIIEHRRPFYTANAQHCPELIGHEPEAATSNRYRSFTRRQQVQAFAGLPLLSGRRLVGIMCVNYRHAYDLTDETRWIAELFAQQAGVALENARLKRIDTELALARERSHLSRELHDALVQDLFGLSLKVRTWLQEQCLLDSAAGRLQQILELSEGARGQIGYLVSTLRAQPAGRQDYRRAIDEIVARVRQFYALQVTCQNEDTSGIGLSPAANTALAHVAQEAVTNVICHARANRIDIRTWLDRESSAVHLVVEDDGIGFIHARRDGYGLINMHEFADEAQGEFKIWSTPGHGTRVEAIVPVIETQPDLPAE